MISTEEVRKRMRINNTLVEDEIASYIKAARLDMSRVGIDESADNDLTDNAIELYCKAQLDYMGKGEQFMKNFEKLRDSMSTSKEYKECTTN